MESPGTLGACHLRPLLPHSPLGLPLYGRRIRVLHFEPIGGATGTVGGILVLRDNVKPHLAGVREDGRAVALGMLIEQDDATSLWTRYVGGASPIEV